MQTNQIRVVLDVLLQGVDGAAARAEYILAESLRTRAEQVFATADVDIYSEREREHVERFIDLAADALIGEVAESINKAPSVTELRDRLNALERLLVLARERGMGFWGKVERRAVIDDSALPTFDFEPTMRETFRAYSWGMTTGGQRAALCYLIRGERTFNVEGERVAGPCWYLHRL